jgi:hypothetical protein
MRNRNARHGRAQGTAKSARRVALDDDKPRSLDGRSDAPRHLSHMYVRVRQPRAAELGQRKAGETESRRIEVRMLAGQDDPRNDAAGRKCSSYG